MSLLPQVTGKAGIVVRGQRIVQVGKLNSKSAAAGQRETVVPGGFPGRTVRVARVSQIPLIYRSWALSEQDRGKLRKQLSQLEEAEKNKGNNDGKRDWENLWEDGAHGVREWRERADREAAGIGLTLWDYKAEERRRAEGHLGAAVVKTLCLSFLSVEGLLLHPFDLHC